MTLLGDITAVMSEVGQERPDLVQDRNVSLFIELLIETARTRSWISCAHLSKQAATFQACRVSNSSVGIPKMSDLYI